MNRANGERPQVGSHTGKTTIEFLICLVEYFLKRLDFDSGSCAAPICVVRNSLRGQRQIPLSLKHNNDAVLEKGFLALKERKLLIEEMVQFCLCLMLRL